MASQPLPLETDPEMVALLNDCESLMDQSRAAYREAFAGCFGQSVEAVYAALANSLLVAGQRAVAGYQAQGRRASGARHLAISLGAVKAPRRMSAADKAQAEAVRWGLAS